MQPEQQYLIKEISIWLVEHKNGIKGFLTREPTENDKSYYKYLVKETRYVILKASGGIASASIYESPLSEEAYFASGCIKKTRR